MSTEPRRKSIRTATMLAVVLGTALSAAAAPAETLNGISGYCTASWRNARLPADVWPDCTQEVFASLLERLPADVWNDALKPDGDEHLPGRCRRRTGLHLGLAAFH